MLKTFLILTGVAATLAAASRGGLWLTPYFGLMLAIPLFWSLRLKRVFSTGTITSRLRTGSRTTSSIAFSFSEKDEFSRASTPIRYWATLAGELLLFLIVSGLALMLVISAMLSTN